MTQNSKALLSLVSVALLTASSALAQQPAAPAPTADDAAAPIVRSTPRPPRPMQSSTSGNSRELHLVTHGGMNPGSRIAPPGIWWKNPDIIQKLTLTEVQQKKMDDIFQQSRIQLIDVKANLEKQEVALEPMLAANPPDTNKVLAQIDRIAQARAELEKANAKMLLGIRAVLTADQWTKLQESERSHRGMGFKGPGDAGGPGGPGMMRDPGARNDNHHEFRFTDPDNNIEGNHVPEDN
jgi:Spy/CpxP family protein refolding chaperone